MKLMRRIVSSQAVHRINTDLKISRSSQAGQNFKDMESISKDVCEQGGLVSTRCLEF